MAKTKPKVQTKPAAIDPLEIVRQWQDPVANQAKFSIKAEADARGSACEPHERLWFKAWDRQLDDLRECLRAEAPGLLPMLPLVKFHGAITASATEFASAMVRIEAELLLLAAHDTQHDTPKKPRKKLRQLNLPANDCIRRYKNARKTDPTISMTQVVAEYVEEMGEGSQTSIMRVLADHPDQWKDDTNTT